MIKRDMPIIQTKSTTIHFKLEGKRNAPTIVFSNSLGTDLTLWDGQMADLSKNFQILRYDTRGHGKSGVPEGFYTIEQCANDVLELLDSLNLERVYFVGLSMGGMIGQYLALNAPERLHKLVLSNTAAKIGTPAFWNPRIQLVLDKSVGFIADAVMQRWLTAPFLTQQVEKVAHFKNILVKTSSTGYAACCAAVRDFDVRDELSKIQTPTLVISGTEDVATTVEDGLFLKNYLKNAQLLTVPTAHFGNIEAENVFNQAIIDFFKNNDLTQAETHAQGMTVRCAVLGDAHVNRANSKINAFNADFQHFITRYAWGEIWTRTQLPRHDRSLITLAMMIALNREDEFKMHVKAAINNGVTVDEIKEVILQSGIYCGLPAANGAYHAAEAVLKDLNLL
jgi:3-oxoadipate enol-lactonase / 4-carboxymuconolactone decarboxylase